MDGRFFDEMRQLIARGSIDPVVPKVVNAVQGAREALGNSIANAAVLLSRRYFSLQLERVKRTESQDDLDRKLNGLTDDLLSLIAMVESQWGNLPEPAAGPAPKEGNDHAMQGQPPDFREAAMAGNPLRRLAWLEKGIMVARAVCKIRTPNALGTGFLIRGGKIVTNNHVLPSRELSARSVAVFNFEEDLFGRPAQPVVIELASETFKTNPAPEIDCTIVAVNASQAELTRWGFLELNCQPKLSETTGVSIIQHPEGGYKQIAIAGNIISRSDVNSLYYITSTMQGSSGAPVLDDDWKVIALHQGGGNWSNEYRRFLNNKGIRFSAISAAPEFAAEFS